ncbi:histidine phosphotransferase ChpT [Hyphobacterium sp.]|jgi:histidine phosphotransferase ChpT|uniref:histidine phosphotransferase ChpT n=1 Tax=Hyphobacterium sp. TaxID=2004662 RepID=UPI003BA9E708
MTDTSPANMAPEQLAALLCARLCHDLVSPVSAMGMAFSVLDDEDADSMREDAIELVRENARQAEAKLAFARIAFGAAGSAPGMMETGELKSLAENYFSTLRPDLVWKVTEPGLEKTAARLLLNLCMAAGSAAARGGTVTVEASDDGAGGTRMRLIAEGPRAELKPDFEAALNGQEPEDGFNGRSIQPYYAGLIARSAGGRVTANQGEDRVEFVSLIVPKASLAA